MSEMAILKYCFIGFAGVGTLVIGYSYVTRAELTRLANFFLVTLLSSALLGIYVYFIEPSWIETKTIRVEDAALASVIQDTKIVQISDFHLTEGVGYREKKLIRKVNALEPDIILITGDLFDDLTQVEPVKNLLSALEAKIGIYGVPGNTDHLVMDAQSMVRELADVQVDILVNESREILLNNHQTLWLVGVDDAKSRNNRSTQAFRGVPKNVPVIMISHNPDILDDRNLRQTSVILAGDTHGGQVGVPFLIKMSDYANRTPYMRGWYEKDGHRMYVNRGIGMKTIPIRFLSRPEITIVEATR